MVKIGLVNIDTSHPLAFSKILNAEGRARYAAIFNDGFRGDDEVIGFMKNAGIDSRADTVEELADITDIGFIQGCDWDRHLDLALPFINRGKPVFLDKPAVGSLADCDRLESLVENGAVILGSSSVRYCSEIAGYLARPVSERGEIAHVYGTSGVDEFNYGVHIVEGIGALLGTGAESCAFCGRGSAGGMNAETFNIAYANGKSATYTLFHGTWHPFEITVMTTKETARISVDNALLYKCLLDRICNYMETGVNKLATARELTESIKIMLAGKVSRERGGTRVAISKLPEYAPAYDGREFERGYAAAASKIYL